MLFNHYALMLLNYFALMLLSVSSVKAAVFPNQQSLNQQNFYKIDIQVVQNDSPEITPSQRNLISKRYANYWPMTLIRSFNIYFAYIYLGSSKQKCKLVVDTGSCDTWVVGDKLACDAQTHAKREEIYGVDFSEVSTENNAGENSLDAETTQTGRTTVSLSGDKSKRSENPRRCFESGYFNTSDSKTYRNRIRPDEFLITYIDNTHAAGVWGVDNVWVANTKMDFSFGVVDDTPHRNGVLGLGPSIGEQTNAPGLQNRFTYPNFPEQLKNKGIIKKSIYSLYLDSKTSSTGSILFGAVDHQKYTGKLRTLPIINLYKDSEFRDSLAVILNQLYLENGDQTVLLLDDPIGATLDSGTSMLLLPRKTVDAFVNALDGKYNKEEEFYEIDCAYMENSGHLVFNFKGIKINVPISDLILKYSEKCYLAMMAHDEKRQYASAVLGTVFLRSAYVVYDMKDMEISMAQASYTKAEDIEVISKGIPGAVRAPGYYHRKLVNEVRKLPTERFRPSGFRTSELNNFKQGDEGQGEQE